MMALASVWSYALLHWAKEFTGLRLGCTQGWSQGIRQPPWQFLVWLLCPISAASKHDVFLLSGVRASYHPPVSFTSIPTSPGGSSSHLPETPKPFHFLQPARWAEHGPGPSRAPKGTWALLPPSHVWGPTYPVWPVQPGHRRCLCLWKWWLHNLRDCRNSGPLASLHTGSFPGLQPVSPATLPRPVKALAWLQAPAGHPRRPRTKSTQQHLAPRDLDSCFS